MIHCDELLNETHRRFQSESEIEYGLIVLWEVLEHLASCIEGREADIFSVLLKIRYCNKGNVSRAEPG